MLSADLEALLTPLVEELWDITLTPGQKLLETPRDPDHGDFASSLPLRLTRELGRPPIVLAHELSEALSGLDAFSSVEAVKPGFVNLRLSDSFLTHRLESFDPHAQPKAPTLRRVVTDSSHPNIAKPLHFGHFRSTVIGESLARILRSVGHEVLQDNFLGDWGTQFGKMVVAIQLWADPARVDQMTIQDMVELYQRFNREAQEDPSLDARGAEAFRMMEQEADPEITRIWREIVKTSLAEVQELYDLLDIHFDIQPGERGESHWAQIQHETLQRLESEGVAFRDEGALVVRFPEELSLPNMLFQKTDGATLYQTRDVTRVLWYASQGYDDHLYIVGSDQSLHFRQIFATARLLGVSDETSLQHVSFGMVLLPEGRLSTRQGRTIDLMEVITEAISKATALVQEHNPQMTPEQAQEAGSIIGIGALKFQDMGQQLNKDVTFSLDEMLRFDGYSGPSIQYAAVRARSLLVKAQEQLPREEDTSESLQVSLPQERELLLTLEAFPLVVLRSASEYAPHHICQHLYLIATSLNRLYAHCPVLKEPDPVARATRIRLLGLSQTVLTRGLHLLGVEVPERM